MSNDDKDTDRAGRGHYRFTVNGVSYQSNDAELSGRDVLRIAGFNPASDHVLIQVTRPSTHSVGIDDPLDLTTPGKEEFWAFASDRTFNFTVDELGYEWGAATISDGELRVITGASEDQDFKLERADEPDRIIGEGESVNLDARGTEHLRIVKASVTIIVNAEERKVTGRRITFEQLVVLAFETPPTGPNILITIDYGKGPPQNPKGSLEAGQSVKIKNRMVFDVTATDRS